MGGVGGTERTAACYEVAYHVIATVLVIFCLRFSAVDVAVVRQLSEHALNGSCTPCGGNTTRNNSRHEIPALEKYR